MFSYSGVSLHFPPLSFVKVETERPTIVHSDIAESACVYLKASFVLQRLHLYGASFVDTVLITSVKMSIQVYVLVYTNAFTQTTALEGSRDIS